jgi:hypothetical protein
MLEEHMVVWMRKWKVGFGTMGEQGDESIHANGIERSFANMVHNRVDRLRCGINEHYLRVSPDNICLLPAMKRKNQPELENIAQDHTSP